MSELTLSKRTAPTMTGTPVLRPEQLEQAGSFEIVVPYTGSELTARVVQRAVALAAGLNLTLQLVAVYVVPYPAELRCPIAIEKHLIERLTEIAEKTGLPASIHLAVSRDRNEGFRRALRPGSTVLLGCHRRFWRTGEEKLARTLARQGHHVSLLHFD